MKAEKNLANIASANEVGDINKDDVQLSEKLKAAAGNINRANSSVIARQTENDLNRKRAEREARARLREEEKQRAESEKQARRAEEQRLAEFEYAENYRKKLIREQKRALEEQKLQRQQEREAREAIEREERAREIAEALEAERAEARERTERATEILNRLIEKRAAAEAAAPAQTVVEEAVEQVAEVVTEEAAVEEIAAEEIAVEEIPVEQIAAEEPVAEEIAPEEAVVEEVAVEEIAAEEIAAEEIAVEEPVAEENVAEEVAGGYYIDEAAAESIVSLDEFVINIDPIPLSEILVENADGDGEAEIPDVPMTADAALEADAEIVDTVSVEITAEEAQAISDAVSELIAENDAEEISDEALPAIDGEMTSDADDKFVISIDLNDIGEAADAEPAESLAESLVEDTKVEPKIEAKPKISKISDEERAAAAAREVEEFLANEMVTVTDDKFVINIIDDVMTVEITEDDDPLIAPKQPQGGFAVPGGAGFGFDYTDAYASQVVEANARHSYILEQLRKNASLAKEESLRLMMAEEARYNKELELLRAHREELSTAYFQQLQMLENEIKSLKDATLLASEKNAEPEAIEPSDEDMVKDEPKNKYEPARMNDPLVLSVKDEGALVYDNRSLARYLKNSAKIVKGFEEQISRFEAGMASGEDGQGTSSLIIEILMISAKLLEIKCDNLSTSVKVGRKKSIKKCSNLLYDEIERYNMRVADYATLTGEQLTPISSFLPAHLENRTGTQIIPVLSYAESFVEIGVPTDNKADYYTLTIPGLTQSSDGRMVATGATLTSSVEDDENSISRIAPIVPSVTADSLLGAVVVTNNREYKQLQKQVSRADKKITGVIEDVQENIEHAGWRREKLRLIVEECALHREKLLLYFAVLAAAVSLGNRKTILSAKRALVLAMNEYNRQITACSVGLDMPLTRVTSNLADEVIQGDTPTVPQMACLIELLETVGDTVRVIGEKTNLHTNESITVILGGAVEEQAPEEPTAEAPTENDYMLVNQPTYTMSPQAMVQGYNAETSPFASGESRGRGRKVSRAAEAVPRSVHKGAQPKSEALMGYLKESDGRINSHREKLLIINNEKRGSVGRAKAECILSAIATEKEIIDEFCISLGACCSENDSKSAERIAGRFKAEIRNYNGLIKEWQELTNQHLPIADPNMPEYIMAGIEYHPLPHISASGQD